jgi:hypothetical protein
VREAGGIVLETQKERQQFVFVRELGHWFSLASSGLSEGRLPYGESRSVRTD